MEKTLLSTFSLFDENGNELKITLIKESNIYKVKLFSNDKIGKIGEEYTCSLKAEALSIYNYMIYVATKDMLY